MKGQEANEYINEMGESGYAVSVATNIELRIVRTFVDADDLGYPMIINMPYGYPLILGGPYNGHRLVHHSVAVDVGQRLIGKFS